MGFGPRPQRYEMNSHGPEAARGLIENVGSGHPADTGTDASTYAGSSTQSDTHSDQSDAESGDKTNFDARVPAIGWGEVVKQSFATTRLTKGIKGNRLASRSIHE